MGLRVSVYHVADYTSTRKQDTSVRTWVVMQVVELLTQSGIKPFVLSCVHLFVTPH